MPTIEMFFDHTCPYCHRGHKALMELLPKYPSVKMQWRPVEAHPKTEEPEHKPYEDLAVQGSLFIRDMGGDELAYHERLYRAWFEERLAVDDIATLAKCAGEVGADAVAFENALRGAAYEKAQRKANDYAYEQNKVWAVPTFVCGEKRLDAKEGVGVTKEQLDAFLAACCGQYRMAKAYVSFTDVVREYQTGSVMVRAADGVSFSLEKGAFSVIVGPSGAGKTTVLNILGGMDAATSGAVSVDGRDISRLSKRDVCSYRRNDVGFVFQFYNLIPNLTALENVELASQICKDALAPRAVLQDVGLGHRLDNFPAQLSGGEQQRVAIARALSKNPKLLLCDEPTGALDYNTGKSILQLLQDTCRQKGVTVVVITHNLAITPIADRIVKIKSGKVETVTDNPDPKPVSEIEW